MHYMIISIKKSGLRIGCFDVADVYRHLQDLLTDYEASDIEIVDPLMEKAVEFVVASVDSRPVYAIKRHQEDGSFKWVVTGGHGGERSVLHRSLMEICYESSPSSEKTKEHMADTRFATLEEAMSLAQEYQAKKEKQALTKARKDLREALGAAFHSIELVDMVPSEWDADINGIGEFGITRQINIFVKDVAIAEEANKKRRLIGGGYPFKIKVKA